MESGVVDVAKAFKSVERFNEILEALSICTSNGQVEEVLATLTTRKSCCIDVWALRSISIPRMTNCLRKMSIVTRLPFFLRGRGGSW
jgi:hypothetical protein